MATLNISKDCQYAITITEKAWRHVDLSTIGNGDDLIAKGKPFEIWKRNPAIAISFRKRRSQYIWNKYHEKGYNVYDYKSGKYIKYTAPEWDAQKLLPNNQNMHRSAYSTWVIKSKYTEQDIATNCYTYKSLRTGLWFRFLMYQIWSSNKGPVSKFTSGKYKDDAVYYLEGKSRFDYHEAVNIINPIVGFETEQDFMNWFGEGNYCVAITDAMNKDKQ